MKNKIIVVFMALIILLIGCSKSNNNEEKISNNINESVDKNITENSKDNVNQEFFNNAKNIYEEIDSYINSFSETQAPSGMELLSKTINLVSFLNNEAKKNKNIVKTNTYKALYNLFVYMDNISEENKKALENDNPELTDNYVSYFKDSLKKINPLLDEIKSYIEKGL